MSIANKFIRPFGKECVLSSMELFPENAESKAFKCKAVSSLKYVIAAVFIFMIFITMAESEGGRITLIVLFSIGAFLTPIVCGYLASREYRQVHAYVKQRYDANSATNPTYTYADAQRETYHENAEKSRLEQLTELNKDNDKIPMLKSTLSIPLVKQPESTQV